MLSVLVAILTFAWIENPRVVHVSVSGLHCENCVAKVEKALNNLKDVEKVSVSLEKGEAVVTLASTAKLTIETLVNTIAKAGYEAKVGKVHAKPSEKCDDDCKDEKDQVSKDGGCCATGKKSESTKSHGNH
jgi:copper chaperone